MLRIILIRTKISTRWIIKEGDLEGKGDIEFGYHELIIKEPGTIPFGINQEQDLLFPRGKCEVTISVDNKEVKTASFTIEKPSSPEVEILSGTDYSPSSTEIIPKTYSWNYKGEDYMFYSTSDCSTGDLETRINGLCRFVHTA